mmetsp:Transcript_1580/g.5970  ORF Transcript_1580/g.5970 Transcript_1580/m.5970 type:complete len:209 (-) Transcript_1580:14-640(-)
MPWPTNNGSRCNVPISATIARSTSLTQNFVSSAHTRMSHATARSTPPPKHAPCIAQITGARHFSTAVNASCNLRTCRNMDSALRPAQSTEWVCCPSCSPRTSGDETSIPAQKFFPAPHSTTHRTSVLLSSHCSAAGMSTHIWGSKALDLFGRFKRRVPTCVRRSTSTTTVANKGGRDTIETGRAPGECVEGPKTRESWQCQQPQKHVQ